MKFILCLTASLFIVMQSIGQERDRNGRSTFDREAFIAKRNTFLTEKMSLTAEETAVFIPLDNELMRKKLECGRGCRRLARELQNKSDKTDEEYQKLLKCREEVREQCDKLDKEYLEKFKKVLSAEQIVKYQNADKAFFEEFKRDQQ